MKNAFRFLLAAPIFVLTALTVNAQTGKDLVLQRLSQSDLPVIRAQKGFSTLIEFPADQKIVDVTCGDKEFWVVEGGGRYLHIKPAKEGVMTNLNVVMEGDIVYAFLLKEISRSSASEIADLHVTVKPSEDAARLSKRLASGGKESGPPTPMPAQSSQAPVEANERPQVPNEKNDRHEQSTSEAATH